MTRSRNNAGLGMVSSCCVVAILLLAAVPAVAQDWFVATNGNDGNVGTSWGSPFLTISNAVANASAGQVIVVSNGFYQTAATIVVTNDVDIIGFSGDPKLTIVRGPGGGNFRLFDLSDAGITISGLTLTNGWLSTQGWQGSAAYMTAGTITNCLITGCQANRGSTIYMTGGLVTHCDFISNQDAGNSGGTGGIRMSNGALVRYCTFTLCRPGSNDNGAMCLYMTGNSTAENCIFTNNLRYSSVKQANTITMQAGDTVRNCLSANNPGRGIRMTGGTVENFTTCNNTVYGGQGNGIYMTAGKVLNSIAYYNGAALYAQLASDIYMTGGLVSNTCAGVLLAGGGNTAEPPLFADPDNYDFTLLPGSPCIDTGMELASITNDLIGNARPVDGDGDSNPYTDMGCYEAPAANSGVLRCGFTASIHETVGAVTVVFTPYVAGTDTNITYAGWDFGDGNSSNRTDLSTVSNAYSPGLYTVSLTVSNVSTDTAVSVITNDIRIAPVGTYVSTVGSHTAPYDDWSRAATNIQAAMDSLLMTGAEVRVVMVTNGTYDVSTQLDVFKSLRIESVNGPLVTFVRGTGGVRLFNMADPQAVVSGFTITNGTIGAHGAGVYMVGGTLTNCVVTGCIPNRGSSVYCSGGLITRSIIRGNTENGNSGGVGGVYLTAGALMEWCTLTDNRPGSNPGSTSAVWLNGNSTLQYCTIVSNRVYQPSQVKYTVRMAANDVVRNCLIADNPAARGVHMTGGTVENCTITKNTVGGDSGNGINATAGLVRNTIIWDNGGDNSANLNNAGATVEFCDVNPSEPGNGNKNVDPAFQSPGTGNYELDPASPCIDVGTNVAWMSTAVDLVGTNRIIMGTVDMGTYEAPDPASGPLTCNFDAPTTVGFTNLQVVFTSVVVGGNTNIDYYWWDFGDAQSQEGATKEVVTNTYTAAGYYDVTLTVSNSTSDVTNRVKTSYIYVPPTTAYVATNGAGTAPYETWAKAATNIQDAISIARVIGGTYTTIMMTNGVYPTVGLTEISKGITIRSVNGASNTIIARVGASTKAMWIHHADAVLDGITVSNGVSAGQGDPGGLTLQGGSVLNCIFTKNNGNRACAVYIASGLVSNSVIRDSRDNGNSGNTGGVKIDGGRIIDCTIIGNDGGSAGGSVGGIRISGGEVWNCTIVSNVFGSSGETAGGVYIDGGVMRNCLIVGNDNVGLRVAGGSVENVTIARNAGVGVNMSAGVMTNSIIYFNNNGGVDTTGAVSNYVHSCSPGLSSGTGNITDDPVFLEPGEGYGLTSSNWNFRLKAVVSPCVEGGTNLAWMASAYTLDGELRILNKIVDIGAYENFRDPGGTVFMFR